MKKPTPLYAGEPRGLDADAAWHDMIDPADMIDVDPAEWALPPGEPRASDPARDALIVLEDTHARARVLIAEQYAAMAQLLRDARKNPDPWVGPDPTLDSDWIDPRERTAAHVRRDRRDLAVRAAAADIAVRLRMSETTVRAKANLADTLKRRCPKLWALFLGGAVSEPNARIAATAASDLSATAKEAWTLFDEQVSSSAQTLTPAKLRVRVRVVRDRVHPSSIEDRHKVAAKHRTAWLNDGDDAMSTLTIEAPTVALHAAWNVIDTRARHLRTQADETRTLAQLRADVAADLLTGGDDRIDPVVAITVPVLTLLGHDKQPATLDGYGPIDLDTAKKLAGKAKSWVRILTHPVTGTILDVDRKTRRPPADLRRWVRLTQPTCTFPGCSRSARDCDIDHRLDWAHGGPTSADNLGPQCEPHHIVQHGTLWQHERDPDTGEDFWTSPTGHRADLDPPPF
ncbi:MAG TPA: HNH endonuclease [Microbacterium sp.]|nr:HNH endonuclease [Microbacterium sp.]